MTLLTFFAAYSTDSEVDIDVPEDDVGVGTPVGNILPGEAFGGSRSTGRAAGPRPVGLVGGTLVGEGVVAFSPQAAMFVNGIPVVVTGATSTTHGEGIHTTGSHIIIGTSSIIINGVRAVRTGDPSTCGHPAIALVPAILA